MKQYKQYKVLEIDSNDILVQVVQTVKYYYLVVIPCLLHFVKETK